MQLKGGYPTMNTRQLTLAAFLLIPAVSFALYNGSPSLPEMPENGFFMSKNSFIAVKVGYEGDYLLGRSLDASHASDPGIRSMLNGGTLTLGFINRVELYSLLGATKSKVSVTADSEKIQLKTGQDFGGEIGIRANTPIWGDMKFGFDAKYFYAWPSLSSIKIGGNHVVARGKVFQKEWQVGASISQTFAYSTPYVGVKFSRFYINYADLNSLRRWIPSKEINIQNEGPFGCFIGMGIAGKTGVYFDFEARFIDEYGLTGALGISF
jgi:hypothetical protein